MPLVVRVILFALNMAIIPKTVLIDLDGCLMPSKLTQSVPNRVAQYSVKYLGYDANTAVQKCREAYRRNGTNLEGFLREGHDIDPDHYHSFIHGSLPYTTHVHDMAELRSTLNALPASLYVYTNADIAHVKRCLSRAGLSDCFAGLLCFETLQQVYKGPYTACKPKHGSLRAALSLAGDADFETTLFFDDQPRNIAMGLDYGVSSILVGKPMHVVPDDYVHIPSILDCVVFFGGAGSADKHFRPSTKC